LRASSGSHHLCVRADRQRIAPEDVGEEAGFEQFSHRNSHGVGVRYLEALWWITQRSDGALVAGMTIVTEPGVLEEGLGAFRGEADAVVTADSAVRLAQAGRELD
jgi:Xaa-Pro aminopeptidase